MGISKHLTGTPWHIEKMVRAEGDPRRHRSRCCYFRKTDTYCTSYKKRYIGSAHCNRYNEDGPKCVQEEPAYTPAKQKTIVKPRETDCIALAKTMLPVGSIVHHSRFGDGQVVRFDGEFIIIDFNDVGNKTMPIESSIKQLKKIDRFTMRQSLAKSKE